MTEEFAWRAALASAIIEGKGGEEIPPSEAGRVLALDTSGKFLKLPSHFAEFAQVGSHDLHIGFLYFVLFPQIAQLLKRPSSLFSISSIIATTRC
jgi:hypothetical protein